MNWEQLYHPGRVGKNSLAGTDDSRNPYQIDYDRIIFSSAFRRLQDKTQVFPLPARHLVHNRLTHSLEVASVGRSLGHKVGLWLSEQYPSQEASFHRFYTTELSSVIASACLAHDIGNPPFGHSGEKAISNYFIQEGEKSLKALKAQCSPAQWLNFTAFEGNANGLRVLTSDLHGSVGGMRLTYTTLASMIKYPCAADKSGKGKSIHQKKYGYFESEKETFQSIQATFQLPALDTEGTAYARHPFVYLVEAADDICYQIMDIEDAHRLGIIPYATVEPLILDFLPEAEKDSVCLTLKRIKDNKQKVGYLRAIVIHYLVDACVNVFQSKEKELLSGTLSNSLMDNIPEPAAKAYQQLAQFSMTHIYNYAAVVSLEIVGYKVLGGLLEEWLPAVLNPDQPISKKLLTLLPEEYKSDFESDSLYIRVLRILDFISGMTDNYAVSMYRHLKGIDLPEIK